MIDINKIYEGDALILLKTFPDKIFNCCVTSPPYYGLRAYGTNPVIWDGDENCQHEFTEEIKKGITGGVCVLEGAGKAMTEARYTPDTKHGFCIKCGAWRGELGSEPSPELFIKHLVDIFREVKRVLKPDGTLWLNLGDTYFASNQGWGDTKTTNKNHNGSRERKKPIWDKSSNLKPKDLIGIPWMVAFALRTDGWYLRSDIIWHKRNPMPESVTDRPTKAHEYIFLLSKSQQYYYDYEAILEVATGYDGRKDTKMKGSKKYQNGYFPTDVATQSIALVGHERWKNKIRGFKEKDQIENPQHHGKDIASSYGLAGKGFDGHSGNLDKDGNLLGHDINGIPARNKRSVWDVPTKPFKEAHFATFPETLVVDMIKAGSPEGGLVLDPFGGANTTGLVARKLNRNYVAIELNPKYIKIGEKREYEQIGLFL